MNRQSPQEQYLKSIDLLQVAMIFSVALLLEGCLMTSGFTTFAASETVLVGGLFSWCALVCTLPNVLLYASRLRPFRSPERLRQAQVNISNFLVAEYGDYSMEQELYPNLKPKVDALVVVEGDTDANRESVSDHTFRALSRLASDLGNVGYTGKIHADLRHKDSPAKITNQWGEIQ